jgi:UDP:flavonoid glycosyltransferase YjiC (YdhE family)
MRITILTIGSRGDVQPYIALGIGLHQAGHQVRIATYDKFRALIQDQGLAFSPIASDVSDIARSLEGKGAIDLLRSLRGIARLVPVLTVRLWRDTLKACLEAETIIYGFVASVLGHCAAEELGVPCLATSVYPVASPTHAFPNLLFPALPLSGTYNWLTHFAFDRGLWQTVRLVYGHLEHKNPILPPLPGWPYERRHGKSTPILYAYSPAIVPKPPDWDDQREVTGYWFLDSPVGWQPPDELVAFLESGPPPVYIGFGSMSLRNSKRMTEIVLEALARSRQRGLLVEGWGGLGNAHLPDDVLRVKSVPFDWLFPRVAAVVHHGGAGTTALGLRAGVPSILVPFIADQRWWGRRVAALGVGPEPIPHGRLSAERLAAAIAAATSNQAMQRRAAALGRRIRAENGVAKAIEVLHRHVSAG